MDYSELSQAYHAISTTSKRLEKTALVANLLRHATIEELPTLILLLQGRIFPVHDQRKIGVAAKMVMKAITVSTGYPVDRVEKEWKQTGDLGHAAENLVGEKKQQTLFSETLTVHKVYANLVKLSTIEGAKSVDKKIQLISELLTSATKMEARFIIRTVLEDMRVGIGSGTMRDAITWACFPRIKGIPYDDSEFEEGTVTTVSSLSELNSVACDTILPGGIEARDIYNHFINAVQEAYDITNDFGTVAQVAKEKGLTGLESIEITIGQPLNLMLYQKAHSIEDAFKTVGSPAALEFKYDGFRMEIHKKGDEITLFTRRLENVTKQFPDVVEIIKRHTTCAACILDAEVIGYDASTGRFKPFQEISKRIRRKYDIEQIQKEIPIVVNVFDAIAINNQTLLKTPFKERRAKIAQVIDETKNKIVLAEQLITDDVQIAEEFYKKALDLGNEGIMMKNLEGIYKPGSRVGYGMKIKPVMETLDVIVVAAEWGEGKRSGWLTSFTIAVLNEDNEFVQIGKVASGFKEKSEEGTSFGDMTELIRPLITTEKGREVQIKPDIVIEVHYEEIQKSPTYGSGYALRFPRFVRLRSDRGVDEISDLTVVEDLFYSQRGKG